MAIPIPSQIWYDPANPEPLHQALRENYAAACAVVQRRPSLVRHMRECAECQAITASVSAPANPTAGRKRIKLVINPGHMHQLLGLPAHFEIVHMFADDDPNTVSVLVAGEGLPTVQADDETPISPATAWAPRAASRDTTNTTS
jgi:hypothetical protein